MEHKLGWDRNILCWGDRFVPPEDRWVAIRSAVPRKKQTMGKFWDVPGSGKEAMKVKDFKKGPYGFKTTLAI